MVAQPINVSLPDGTRIQVPAGSSAGEALTQAGHSPRAGVFAAKVNGVPTDLSHVLRQDASVEPLTFDVRRGTRRLSSQQHAHHGAGRQGAFSYGPTDHRSGD